VIEVVSDQDIGDADDSRSPLSRTSAARADELLIAHVINVKTEMSTGNRLNSLTANTSKCASSSLAMHDVPQVQPKRSRDKFIASAFIFIVQSN
jgi:hypothetical protein